MKLAEVRRLGRRWQQALRLEDWDIEWRVLPDEKCPDFWGLCERNSSRQSARITINESVPRDELDTVVVHELLHVSLDPVWPTSRRDIEAGERAVHRISRALAAK